MAVLAKRLTVADIAALLTDLRSLFMVCPESDAVVAGRPFQVALGAVSGRPGMALGAFLTRCLG